MSGGFVKIYGTILDSSLWSEAPPVRLLFITMLAMADAEGNVQASVPGLARRANLSLADTISALEVLANPDAFDRSGVDEGRRVKVVAGGWLLVNYERYRDLRTESQVATAERQARFRAKQKAVTSNESNAPETEVSLSPSASLSESGEKDQKPVRRDEIGLVAQAFGKYADDVEGLIRAARYGPAVIAILKDRWLEQQVPLDVLGEAVREYLASGRVEFNAPLFDGFVRRIRGRRAQGHEADEIAQHKQRRATEDDAADRAAAAKRRAVTDFEQTNPARYAELVAEAETLVDPKYQRGRSILVRGKLIELVEREIAGGGHAST